METQTEEETQTSQVVEETRETLLSREITAARDEEHQEEVPDRISEVKEEETILKADLMRTLTTFRSSKKESEKVIHLAEARDQASTQLRQHSHHFHLQVAEELPEIINSLTGIINKWTTRTTSEKCKNERPNLSETR